MGPSLASCVVAASLAVLTGAACISSGDETTVNNALSSGGRGAVVQLCPGTVLTVHGQINFTADYQELSTSGYPTDDTRAVLQIASSPANNVSTIIQGFYRNYVTVRNIVVDGNRPSTTFVEGGGPTIDLGAQSTGVVVTHVASKNPRGGSCLRILDANCPSCAGPCVNATVTNNDIGPCGYFNSEEVHIADGISFACSESLVADNVITGSTDGGIVIFGAPQTTVTGNTVISSETEQGYSAINMVDYTYNGNYSGVVVSNNYIEGRRFFAAGMPIGSSVLFSEPGPINLSGPVTVTGNTITGNVVFPIALNGWENGISIYDNNVSTVTKPNSNFADAYACNAPVMSVFEANTDLSYYSPGVTGPQNLPGFVNSAQDPYDYVLCVTPALPTQRTFNRTGLYVDSYNGAFLELHDGIIFAYQPDDNLVVYNTTTPGGYTALYADDAVVSSGCGSPTLCSLQFQVDGNLVSYYNGTPTFASDTSGTGETLVLSNSVPYIQILDVHGNVVFKS